MGSTFNIGQELFVGMKFESKNAVKECTATICYESATNF